MKEKGRFAASLFYGIKQENIYIFNTCVKFIHFTHISFPYSNQEIPDLLREDVCACRYNTILQLLNMKNNGHQDI